MGRGARSIEDIPVVGADVRAASLREYGSKPKIRHGEEGKLLIHFNEFEVQLDMTPLGYESIRDERDGDDATSARAVLVNATGGQLINAEGSQDLAAGSYIVTGKMFAFGGPPGWKGTISLD